MADVSVGEGVEKFPTVPANPLPYWRRLSAVRHLETGLPVLRAAGGRSHASCSRRVESCRRSCSSVRHRARRTC